MDSHLLESDILLTCLPAEPHLGPELVQLRQHVAEMQGTHLVLDLSCVEMITSLSIGNLLLLQKALSQQGRRLVLCSTHLATRCTLRVAGLEDLFEFAEDKFRAAKVLRRPPEVEADTPS